MDGTGAEKRTAAGVDPLVGKVLSGRFRLVRLLARGGMGKIYEAVQEPLGRPVALKILDIHDAGEEFRQRFFMEAAHCARLTHPNTVRIYDYGETEDGIYYIAMELLRGRTLHHVIEREAPIDPLRALHIVRQLCSALTEAHGVGIIHRDLKPANVFLAPHGDELDFVKVVDFGLVKEMGKESELSRTGHVLGSPMYMAPEQIHNTHVDQRADVYATGLMLYAMLMGRTAFKSGNPLAVLMAQANQKPPTFADANPDVSVPAALEWVVQTAIAKRPDERFASMSEMHRALKACAKELRGELAAPLQLELADGKVVLPEGLQIGTIRAPKVDVAPRDGDGGVTTLVQPEPSLPDRSQRTRAIVLVGTTGVLAAGGVGLIVVGVTLVVAWLLWGGTSEPEVAPVVEPVVVTEPVVETPEPAPEPEPAEPEPPALVEVTLRAEPDADVERDGVFLGRTPLTLRIPEGEEWRVDVKAAGHVPRAVRLAADQPELTVSLERQRAPAAPAPAPVPVPEPVEPPPEPVASPAPEPVPAPAPAPKRRGGDIRNPWAD